MPLLEVLQAKLTSAPPQISSRAVALAAAAPHAVSHGTMEGPAPMGALVHPRVECPAFAKGAAARRACAEDLNCRGTPHSAPDRRATWPERPAGREHPLWCNHKGDVISWGLSCPELSLQSCQSRTRPS